MLCLLAGALAVPLGTASVTLAWTHSVEKIPWEEDWRESPSGLEIVQARVRGSGAGMEPPPEARLVNGAYAWRPNVPPQERVVLRRSGFTEDWRICIAGRCRPMADLLPAEADPVALARCPDAVAK